MKSRFALALFAAAGVQILAGPAVAGQKERPARAPKPPAAAHSQQQQARPRPAQRRPNVAGAPVAGPGILNVERLAQMSPQEREKALGNLPPERREAVMRRLQNYQQMAPAERQRAAFELQRLQRLPPQRQNQVRRSLRQFQDLPEERKAAIGSELDRLNAMPDEERRARMNSEEFRNRYSPAEQQMMSNISEVLPRREEQ